MWNLQEKGKTKDAVKAAIANHPSAKARQVTVDGVAVSVPPLLPEVQLGAINALIDQLPEVPEGAELNVSTWGDETTLNVNVAVELPQ